MTPKTTRARSTTRSATAHISLAASEAQPEAPIDAPPQQPAHAPPPANDTALSAIAPEAAVVPPEGPADDAKPNTPPDEVHQGEIVPAFEPAPVAAVSIVLITEHRGPDAEPAPEPLPAGPKGQPFSAIFDRVMQRAEAMLPDAIVHLSDLRMTPEGHLVAPSGLAYRMNDWARKQLASLLGLRWETWFKSSSGEERAEEINRRLTRTPGEKKIRAWKDPTREIDGIARAFLAPTFTPIDDARLFTTMNTMMRGLLDEYRFTSVQLTDSTTHYTAVHTEAFDVDGLGDLLYPGFHLRNSEVGASALSLDDHWWRLACLNGLMVRVGGKRSLYRTHRAIENDQLAAALVIAIGRLPERWQVSFGWMQAAKQAVVPHPDDAVEAILGDSAEVPKALLEEAQRLVLREGDNSRFGVVQAITYVAHTLNNDPDTRFAMERLAGDYLAASHTVAA